MDKAIKVSEKTYNTILKLKEKQVRTIKGIVELAIELYKQQKESK